MAKHLYFYFGYFVLSMVKCETIHFTNSQNHLSQSKNFTTYELKVPGNSEAITIIETNSEAPIQMQTTNLHQNKRKLSATTSNPPIDMSLLLFHKNFTSNAAVPKKMVYAPSLLNKFMNEYNSKIYDSMRNGHIEIDRKDMHNYQVDDDRLGEMEGQEEHSNRWNKYSSEEKHQTWTTASAMSQKRPNHPFHDKEGWVTMEAVPWSRSQVSKWKPNLQTKPTATVSSFSVYHKGHIPSTSAFPTENSHSSKWHNYNRPNDGQRYPHKSHEYYGNSHEVNFYDNRFQLPPNRFYNDEKSSTHYSDDIRLDTNSNAHDRWYEYNYRPNFDENTNRPWHDSDKNSYNFNKLQLNSATALSLKHSPSAASNYLERKTPSVSDKRSSTISNHPSTYPSRGNGEWILVSTTKGYQYPGHRVQRGMALPTPSHYNESNPPTNVTFKTHKSIKLTVLPAESDPNSKTSKKLMSTSHGGMLEVESSTHTVESEVSLKARHNRTQLATLLPQLHVNGMIGRKKHNSENSNRVYRAVQMPTNKEASSDSSAVLAAVGAGMVPATVAMLMPLVLGRKKRDTRTITGRAKNSDYLLPTL